MKPKRAQLRSQRGVTIVELMVASIIIATILTSVALMLRRVTVVNMESKDIEVATNAAHQEVELIRSEMFDNLVDNMPGGGPFMHPARIDGLGRLRDVAAKLYIDDLGNPTGNHRKVTVTIAWTREITAGTKQISMQTYISRIGITGH